MGAFDVALGGLIVIGMLGLWFTLIVRGRRENREYL